MKNSLESAVHYSLVLSLHDECFVTVSDCLQTVVDLGLVLLRFGTSLSSSDFHDCRAVQFKLDVQSLARFAGMNFVIDFKHVFADFDFPLELFL